MLPRKILLATDGSESAQPAEVMAVDFANLAGAAEVTVMTVVRPMDFSRGIGHVPRPAGELDEAQAMLDVVAERLRGRLSGQGARVGTKVVHAWSPAGAIASMAHEGGECSLIVVGSRGHGGFGSLVLGSVSTGVLHEAHCPVLVVKPE
ncbi:MAG: universal stress protein [Thermoleophilia bacterium]|nr:universal stress protein [Thermoleophilia bacterium]